MVDAASSPFAIAGSDAHISKVSILGNECIHLGFHLVPYIVHTVLSDLPSSTYVLITDSNLAKLHLAAFQDAFSAAISSAISSSSSTSSSTPPRFLHYEIPPGEASKSRETKAEIEDWLLKQRCTRDSVILALGGGVVGDLTGFVAATFMRGVKFVQIPTTLLAMVDSAVGGKTAIDTPLGKNLIGAFHQPSFIFIDAAFLETLPEREFVNGMAEVIKTAAIWSEEEFVSLEQGVESIRSAVLSGTTSGTNSGRTLDTRSASQELLLKVIRGSIAVKSHIVTIDEKETGLRNLVNFGHTIGHAIEAILTPEILHGECVSIGMVLEAEVARSLGVLSNAAVARLMKCLASHGLPISVNDKRIQKLSKNKVNKITIDKLLDVMKVDKKNAGDKKKIVLLSSIGKTYEERASTVADDVIARVVAQSVQVFPNSGDDTAQQQQEVTMSTPGSKSISNRALVLAALSDGTCRIRNLLHSDDTQVMMNALKDLGGADFSWEDNGETLVVQGGSGRLTPPSSGKEIYLGNAGTAARFLTTVCTLTQPSAESTSTPPTSTIITGNARMKERPIGPLVTALRSNGSEIAYVESQGCLPLNIPATGFKGGKIELAASISSQYVSSILLSAPYAQESVELELVGGQVISQPYIDMTVAMMRSFGIEVERLQDSEGKPRDAYKIPKGVYTSPGSYDVESDASSATYPLAIAAITGTTCTISNIGSASLQGDAKFAKQVLEPMGCKVVQTETTTTVTGPPPGHLRALGVVDMEVMTDAFLTASCLAAVATLNPLSSRRRDPGQPNNSTKIIGIANQRVKECNRIRAMMDQLKKFHVETAEHDDGIEIFGQHIDGLVRDPPRVHCYDDHRVAMAFSVLASIPGGPGAILEEKRCVEKTWPSWWDDLSSKLSIRVTGVQLQQISAHQVKNHQHHKLGVPLIKYAPDSTLLITGMRGAGKSHMGRIAAASLNRTLIDADIALAAKLKQPLGEFVAQHGWQPFRVEELALLKELLESKPTGHVISLGGGVVETPEARELLLRWMKEKGPVLNVVRDIDEIVDYLDSEKSRPSLGEPLHDIYARRKPYFEECSSYEIVTHIPGHIPFAKRIPQPTAASVNGHGEGEGEATTTDGKTGRTLDEHIVARRMGSEREAARFFRFITGQQKLHFDLLNDRTSFLALTFPDVTPALPVMNELTLGVDAIELRVDLLSASGEKVTTPSIPSIPYVALQLAQLRQTTELPIVFTVRTHSQGGMFPDDAEDAMFELLQLGIRLGCEFVDVEAGWDSKKTRGCVESKGYTKIIGSYHDWTGNLKWKSEEVVEKYELARKHGDIVKIVSKATSMNDNFEMLKFREKMPKDLPLMTINMGLEGQLSRIMNPVLTPVTHPLLPGVAAPGQLSCAQVQQGLHLLGLLPRKKFWLFGSPISASQSPLIHNTGFQTLGLPHFYDRHETPVVDEKLKQLICEPDFGGASVTIPLKLDVIPLLSHVSEHAKLIGAVNTIVPVRSSGNSSSNGPATLYGDNTDWLAMRDLATKSLPVTLDPTRSDSSTSLVIGAGGTSRAAIYTLHQMGFKAIYVFNRTPANIVKLIDSFPRDYNIVPLTSFDSFPLGAPSVIISTVPAQGTYTSALGIVAEKLVSDGAVYLPESILQKEPAGVVVDMAYKPRRTPLIELAETKGWKTVTGIEILLQQAYHQFGLWTGKKAPEQRIHETVMKAYNASD